MRIILLVLLMASNIVFGQTTKYLTGDYEFENGEIAFMFGDDVKLREQASTESNVLTLLKIGDKIEIIEKTNDRLRFDGMDSPWYKVKFQDKIGYVLGGLISADKVSYKNFTYLVSFKIEGDITFLKTRILDSKQGYIENTSQLNSHVFSISAHGNKGLDDVLSIFEVDYMAEACGIDGGGIYLFFNGKDLLKAIDFSQVGDAGEYWYFEEYIFPSDENGISGKILYKREVGETKEHETEWVETKLTQRMLEWKNNQVLPKIVEDEE